MVRAATDPVIELVYFAGCPHVEAARATLREALAGETDARWVEWNVDDDDVPQRVARYPSPTVLVDGTPLGDVTRLPAEARACRSGDAVTVAEIRTALGR